MAYRKYFLFASAFLLSFLMSAILISKGEAGLFGLGGHSRPERTVASYEDAGRRWGKTLLDERITPTGPLNDDFVNVLKDPEDIDFFNVHSDLKEAFKKGFRMGFEDRIADLVLGPHLTAAAGRIGNETSGRFVKVINDFEQGWADTIRNAINVFIVLISEGSQADREVFIKNFSDVYSAKWQSTQEILKGRNVMAQMSEGGTMLFLDYSKGKTLGALDIPGPDSLKTEIYHQTFKVMGDEWGRRFSSNLIKRSELIDLLRRCKTSLQEVPAGRPLQENLQSNLGIIYDAFINGYGTDADNVFAALVREAGYSEKPVARPLYEPLKNEQGKSQPGKKGKKR
jgi:hypothetical protein